MVFLIFSVHSGKDSLNVSFSSMIRFQSHSSNEGHDGRQRQVKVGSVVSCRTDTAVLRWQEDVGSPSVIASNAFWGNHLFKVVLLTILTFFQYKIILVFGLLQRRDLRAAALHLLYAGIAKCKSNM